MGFVGCTGHSSLLCHHERHWSGTVATRKGSALQGFVIPLSSLPSDCYRNSRLQTATETFWIHAANPPILVVKLLMTQFKRLVQCFFFSHSSTTNVLEKKNIWQQSSYTRIKVSWLLKVVQGKLDVKTIDCLVWSDTDRQQNQYENHGTNGQDFMILWQKPEHDLPDKLLHAF